MTGDVRAVPAVPRCAALGLASLCACMPDSSSKSAPHSPLCLPSPVVPLPPHPTPTPQLPTVDQAKAVTNMLRERSQVPDHVFKVGGQGGCGCIGRGIRVGPTLTDL